MKFNFGIRAKITLLVIAIAGLAALCGPFFLSRSATRMVISHELVDLGDDATLRTWEIRNAVTETIRLFAELLEDESGGEGEMIEAFRGLRGVDPDDADERLRKSPVFNNLIYLELLGGDEPEVLFSRLEKTGMELPPGWKQIEPAQGLLPAIQVSPIRSHKGQAYVCVRAVLPGGENRELAAFVTLLGQQNDPRHVWLLAEYPEDLTDESVNQLQFFAHPAMEEKSGTFWNEGNFRDIIKEALDIGRDGADGSVAQTKPGEDTEPPPPSPLENRPPVLERIQTVMGRPFAGHHYYFVEGTASARLVERIFELREDVDIDRFLLEIQRQLGFTDLRISGLSNNITEVRILAQSKDQLDKTKAAIEKAFSESPAFKEHFEEIDWRRIVTCKTGDVQVNKVSLESAEGRNDYIFLYAGFREELAANVQQEANELMLLAIPVALGAGAFAFILTWLFVRPLQKITRTAQGVTESPNEALLEKVDTMVKSLPVERSDETGDIARALRRLFNEFRAGHRQLDQRVHERTVELEKAMAELRTLDEAKDTFVANVSHELRNPLGTVNNSLQFLEVTDLDEEQEEYVRRGRRAAKTLLALINDLLAYQEIVLGGVILNPVEIELEEFLSHLHDDMENAAGKNANKLVFDHPKDIGSIFTDNLRLRQVLANLVGNACKFTHNGTITLESKRVEVDGEDWFEFRCIDSGRGMTKEEQEKIFSLFYTNKEANQTGTGLGLPISQKLSNLMGGDICLESSEIGTGSTFLVRLPAKKSEESMPSLPLVGGDGERPLVLVIDDDETVREMMKQQLTSQGYEVAEAPNGREGIELAAKLQPAAVTLDAVMPEIDGWEVLSRLKANEATASIPVVMVTFLNREAKGFALGADDYFTKPIDWNRLSHVLENLTDSSRTRHILVVEDDESARTFLSRALTREGWTVEEAENGRAALACMKAGPPDAIVLDLMMPVMDGFEFLAEFEKHEEWQKIPIIVVTAKATTKEEHDILESTVERVLQKGAFSYDELFSIIRKRFDRHHVSG